MLPFLLEIWCADATKTRTFRPPMTNHLFQKIRDAVERQESRLFLETPAGIALTYAGMITLSGRYAEALAEPGLKPGDTA
jgi:hypothetical protein